MASHSLGWVSGWARTARVGRIQLPAQACACERSTARASLERPARVEGRPRAHPRAIELRSKLPESPQAIGSVFHTRQAPKTNVPSMSPQVTHATAKVASIGTLLAAAAGAVTGTTGTAESSGLALHKSAKRWLDSCVNGSAAILGSRLPSSEYWRERRSYLIYRHQFCILMRYAPRAASVLDVGSALPPFVNALTWIQQRTILGPRFAGNVAKGGGDLFSIERIRTKFNVTAVQADFLEWQPPGWEVAQAPFTLAHAAAPKTVPPVFDLVLCSEVIEHIATPREFVRKLLAIGDLVVLSVPYRWEKCNDGCHHKQNRITRDKIAAWAGRQPLAYDIVEESSGERRIICVYRRQSNVSASSSNHA